MIKFSLKCDQNHRFDSWFQSSGAFDALAQAGHLTCPECGSSQITKELMAPRVSTRDDTPDAPSVPAITNPPEEVARAIAELRQKVEKNSDYVGDRFASEARAIHDGDVPERAIHGEAKPEEARALIEDGIEIMPLPFAPKRKMQ